MTHTSPLIEELQARLMFQEDALMAVHKRLHEQDQLIDRLQLQIQHINNKLKGLEQSHAEAPAQERPPHY